MAKPVVTIHERGTELVRLADTDAIPRTRDILALPGGNYRVVAVGWDIPDDTVKEIRVYGERI